jgi:rhamnulokinase
MAEPTTYLGFDLGAESGRAILGSLQDGRLALEEIHRFANLPVLLPDGLHWDVLHLWSDIKSGISLAAKKSPAEISSIGLDTWGVDFALLDRQGGLLGNPYHYRDHRTDGMLEAAFQRISRQSIFEQTGIQFMQINSLYQLFSMALNGSPVLDAAQTFLTIPDLFNYWLSGQVTCEFTDATTTQCYNPRTQDWSWPLLEALKIPKHLFQPVIPPGTVLGPLLPVVCEETGAGAIPVVAPACHDTGSAVVAVPAEGMGFAWISSGTWSILGTEALQPGISDQTLRYNFTNEGGVFGTWRLCKNTIGLWLVQECKRTWALHGQNLSYDEITNLAAGAQPFVAVIDPDDPSFLHPGDMPARIRAYCQRTGQLTPETKGEIIRVALESLALKYRWVLERLEEVTGTRLEPVHIIGGGARNRILNQFTADATGRTVVAGPAEATAIGNILMQAIALGHLASLDDARKVVRDSFAPEIYQPGPREDWDKAYTWLLKILDGREVNA